MTVINTAKDSLNSSKKQTLLTMETAHFVKIEMIVLMIGLSICVFVGGCAQGEYLTTEEGGGGGFGKADITVGPIQTLTCVAESSFVRRGSFARFSVNAIDQSGAKSRNYHLEVTPPNGARIVQRDQVIFDLDGLYEVRCCSNDTPKCDQVAIRVGESTPALSVSLDPFSQGQAHLSGHAVDRSGNPAKVNVNGNPVSSDAQGRFTMVLPAETGLNRYEVIALGSEGEQSLRRAWTLSGPFIDINSISPSTVRLRLSPMSYPMISQVLTGLLVKLLGEYSNSSGFRQVQEGSSLGYSWEVLPTSTLVEEAQVNLVSGRSDGELALDLQMRGFQIFAQGRTRFGGGYWREHDVSVFTNIGFIVYFQVFEGGFEVGDVDINLDQLDLEISELPGFFEGVLEFFFENSIQNELVKVIKSVGNQGLSDILTGFEVREQIKLPEALNTTLELSGQVIELNSSDKGITLGFGLSVDGETDPARVSAPGPIVTSGDQATFNRESSYELALHLDLINRIFFAVWQTGGLDLIQTVPRPIGDDGIIRDELLTIFVTPELPPVVRMGEREGEIMVDLGAMRVDGVLETELGVLNCALEVGTTFRVLLSGGQDSLYASSVVTSFEADVLIAPAGWEIEPTRQMHDRVLSEKVIPRYAELLSTLPIPTADLSGFNLPNIHTLSVRDFVITTPFNSISISAGLNLE